MRAGTLGFVLIGALLSSGFAEAAKMSVIHRFAGGNDGCAPRGVSRSSDGTIFGATSSDKATSDNTIFELQKNTNGALVFKTIFNFSEAKMKYYGLNPRVPVIDKDGILYGATARGGLYDGGIVYTLTPSTTSSTGWAFKALHHFNPTKEAANPGGSSDPEGYYPTKGGLLIDAKGNVYGTTERIPSFESDNFGEVFKLTKPSSASGIWVKSVLHQFTRATVTDGYGAATGLIFDSAGDIFGTTDIGGALSNCGIPGDGCGVIFRLKKPSVSGGAWAYSVIHVFLSSHNASRDGAKPVGSLVRSSTGSIYGVTAVGREQVIPDASGEVFKIDSPTSAIPVYGPASDLRRSIGYLPRGGLAQDSVGNLYGTMSYGGAYGKGTLYKLTKTMDSNNIIVWKKQRLYSFKSQPIGNIALGDSGEIYGAVNDVASSNCGAIYRWTP